MTRTLPRYAGWRSRVVAVASVAALLAISACSSDPNSISEQAKQGDQKGYIAGDGTLEQIAVDERLRPITLEGETLDGRVWSSTSERGKQVVASHVGSWCGPCIKEIPTSSRSGPTSRPMQAVQFMGSTSGRAPSGERRSRRR